MNNIEPLDPEGWFEEGNGFKGEKNNDDGIWMPYHSKGTFLLFTSPSVTGLVLRKIGEAGHKQPNRLYVFISHKLMMKVWGRLLIKMADLVVYVPPGEMFWPSSMNESFVIGFISSLIPLRPWRLRGTTKVMGLGRSVSFLLREIPGDAGSVLHQLQLLLKSVASMSGVLARGLLLR